MGICLAILLIHEDLCKTSENSSKGGRAVDPIKGVKGLQCIEDFQIPSLLDDLHTGRAEVGHPLSSS